MITVILITLLCGAIGYLIDLFLDLLECKYWPTAFSAVAGVVGGVFLALHLGYLMPLGDEEIRGLSFHPTKSASLCPISSDGNVYVVFERFEREEKREVAKIQFIKQGQGENPNLCERNYVKENIIFLPECSTNIRVETVVPKRKDFWKYFTIYPAKEILFVPQNGIKEGKIKTLHSYEFIQNEYNY